MTRGVFAADDPARPECGEPWTVIGDDSIARCGWCGYAEIVSERKGDARAV